MDDKPTFITLSSVKARKVQWLWEPYIPFGMITILEGDPGLGKSFLSMFLALLFLFPVAVASPVATVAV